MPLRKALFFLGKEREIVKTLDKNVNLWTERAKILDYSYSDATLTTLRP